MTRQFDAIVVGSGLGGLTAGALYARSGRRILVLEQLYRGFKILRGEPYHRD